VICSNKYFLILLSLFAGVQLFAAPPVPFSGKLAINGKNFHGNALFSFSIVDGEGTVQWKHAEEPDSKIENFVMNGRYLVLLGGQGMQTLPADLFLQHESLFLRVSVDLKDGQGMRLLEPDQRITSSPYALSAEIARLAERAEVAGGVDAGTITADMLEQSLLADLNRTFELWPISRDMLEEALQDDLNRTITRDRLSLDLIADLNRTVRLQDLSDEVSQSINRPITREMLPQGVRDELNATITRDRLSADVRADLNRTVGITNLSSEVTEKLNREFTVEPGSIGKALLAQDVRDDLNRTITRDRLSQDIIADLNRTVRIQDLSEEVSQSINRPITREMLPQGVRDELNATITRDRLSADVRADLNRTIGIANLSSEVTDKLNQTFSIDAGSITLDQLSQQVRDDINRTITRDRLSSDVLSDINRTITKSMLSQEILDELNASGGSTASVPGSLIAVPANQSAPSGYELYQMGDRKNLVWEEKAPVSVARYVGDSVVVLDGEMYVVGGWTGDENFTLLEKYSPQSNTWQTLSPMPTGRKDFACAALNGKIYAIGGIDSSTVDVYDPINDSWSTGTPLPSVVHRGTALSLDGKIYLFSNASNSLLCFDPETDQWLVKANMPTPRGAAKVVYYTDRIWVIGGWDESRLDTVESYNPTENSWQSEANLTIERNWASAWVANGRIYVAGGESDGTRLISVESYNPFSRVWSTGAPLPEIKFAADAAVINNHVYIASGFDTDAFSNKVFAADLNASIEGVHDLYVKTGDASSGTPTVQAEVADGSIGPSKLSSEVSNALKPVVVGQPISVVEVGGNPAYLAVDVDGVNLSYQWKKDGVDIAGATSRTLSISDLNASQHEGNYTVVVSNVFGSVTSSVAQIDVNGSLTEGLVGWWKFDEAEGTIAYDSSGNERDGNFSAGGNWVNGKIGWALDLNGSTSVQILSYKGLLGTTARSFSGWFKVLDPAQDGFTHLIAWGESTAKYVMYRQTNGFLRLGISGGYIVSSSVIDSDWFHVVATSEENSNISDSKIFLNSVEEDISESVARLINTVSDGDVYLGGEWKGYIDDVRIYDRALSALEVRALYELGEGTVQESGSGTTTVVNGTVADGSITASKIADQTITTNQLSEQILKYLKPEITQQPTAGTIFADTNSSISVSAEGKYLTYQWKKNGTNLTGETNATLTITDANATQHDGNYSVVVSNDFGSVESEEVEVLVTWNPSTISSLKLWLDAKDASTIEHDYNMISSWNDKSVNTNNATQSLSDKQPQLGNQEVIFDGLNDILELPTLGLSEKAMVVFLFNPLNDGGYSVLGSSTQNDHWDRYNINEATYAHHFTQSRIENLALNMPTSGDQILAYAGDSLSPFYEIRLNGSSLYKTLNSFSFIDNISQIGSALASGSEFKGSISEIIILNDSSLNDLQKLEGYLAHKWNLATELPSDHPYKNSAP
jgi:hypothetical protein